MTQYEKSAATLELPAILAMLARHAVSDAAKERALAVSPSTDAATVKRLLAETSAARGMMVKRGGLYPCVVNGANEEAVSLFLQDKIGYLDLFDAVEAALNHFDLGDYTSVEEVLEADRKARAFVRERYGK